MLGESTATVDGLNYPKIYPLLLTGWHNNDGTFTKVIQKEKKINFYYFYYFYCYVLIVILFTFHDGIAAIHVDMRNNASSLMTRYPK